MKLSKSSKETDGNSSKRHQFKHQTKKGKVTVPHPRKEIKIEVLKSIEKQSGLEIREIFKNRNRK